MKDITGAKIVEVQLSSNGTVLWVNVDGVCELRICQMEHVRIMDERVAEVRKMVERRKNKDHDT